MTDKTIQRRRGGRIGASCLMVGLFCAAFAVRCANINTNLTGGPKDSLPPVIVGMTPATHTTKYPLTGNKREIYIEFDEFVQIKDQQKEFFTSPQMKKKPTVMVRGRGIVIQIKDTLLENQTYALNFGSSIRDNNEGNPLNSLRYVFSTGTEVDSIVCSGYTADSYKADSVSKSFIWFFAADSIEHHEAYDSTLFKFKPAAIARAENNGIFLAQNLKPIRYRVYAIEDTNTNQLYDPSIDQVGFIEEEVNPIELPDFAIWYDSMRQYTVADPQLYFRMFTDVTFKRQVLAEGVRPLQHQALLHFGAPHPQITKLELDSIPSEKIIRDPLTPGKDTIALWFNVPSEELPDTIRGRIAYFKHDSINQLVEVEEELKLSWRYIESKEEQKEREKIEKEREKAEAAGEEYIEPEKPNPFKVKMATSGDINPEKGLTLDFDYPLVRFDSTAVELMLEEPEKEPQRVAVQFRRDTANLRRWYLSADWKEASKYRLHIPKGSFTDVAGLQNDSIGTNYSTLDPEKLAVVKINLTPRKKGFHYIVQLLNGGGKLIEEKLHVTGGEVQFNYITPGDIQLRLIEDLNNNGKWDTGNVVERRQPERSELYIDDQGVETFTTKANWEIELSMDMGELFKPVTMENLIELLDTREEQRLQKLAEEEAKRRGEVQPQQQGSGGMGFGGAFGGMGSMGGMGSGRGSSGMGNMGGMGSGNRMGGF